MDYSKRFKGRIMLLVFASSLAVALVFGLSFYFSLVSAESALATKVPELAELAGRFKSTLTLNTLAFAGIIFGSFIALGSLVSDRLFKPLDSIEKGLRALASGTVPAATEGSGQGPFDTLWRSFESARSRIESRELSEIATLEECVAGLDRGIDVAGALLKLLEAKKACAGGKKMQRDKSRDGSSNDPLFMQPV
ncbi:MAG TPA: hypothetical protein ENO08_00785 [Candidatus Eisenbacteria bacterium]|uniref:HAMP domain-containing protein n=1 Tax=Eiseniibacteriota bacterium TaxID=2212470 RepID=A0A7V2F2Z8_UNCEI|nr:hypothetical protein [Candidatus Eisenbacteria bacterium]